MWKEDTQIESEEFPSKREVRENCKRYGCLSYFCCLNRRSQDGFHIKTKLSALQN